MNSTTRLRLAALACLAALVGVGLPAIAQQDGPAPPPQDASLIYKIYLSGVSRSAGGPKATPSPKPTQIATATPAQTVTSTPTPAPSPTLTSTPTPGGPTATALPPGAVDLSINSLELTQGMQTDQNSIALVASRQTVLRAYARTSSSTAMSNVSLSITASRDGVALAGSPLLIGPRSVPQSPTRGAFDSSFNALLPQAWLSGQVMVTATIDSANTVVEANEANNIASLMLSFTGVAPLDVMIVPIRYTHTPNGQVYPAPTADSISAIITKLYPISSINASWHAPVNFTGDMGGSSAWSTLLNQVTSLRQSEVGSNSPRIYYALVPIQNASDRWFNSGIAGIGWLGGNRAAVGLDLGGTSSGFIAAHEIGHNLGRYHAPCGNPSGVDPNFPYPNASISQFGLDVPALRVWSPGAPDNAKDMMSYCNPQWISDYTYVALLNALRGGAQVMSVAAPQNGVLVRADLPEAGAPSLQPAYALTNVMPDAVTPSDYEARLLDAAGNVLVAQPVALLQASAHTKFKRNRMNSYQSANTSQDAPAPMVRSIQAILPQPIQPVARMQVLQAGVVIAERPLNPLPSGQPAVITNLMPDAGGMLRWGVPGRPALARMTTDGGTSWMTLGVDVTAGEIQLDLTSPLGNGTRFEVVLSDAIP